MSTKGKVFISYSHPKKEKIQYLVDYLKRETKDEIEILIDEENVIQNSNGLISNFIKKVEDCDAAILFLSPDYLKKILEQKESISVYDEYKRVIARFLKLKKDGYYNLPTEIGVKKGKQKRTKYFKFFPIVVSGRIEDSVPQTIINEGILINDFTSLIVNKEKNQLKSPNFKDFKTNYDNIINDIIKICSGYQEDFKIKWQKEFNELFADTKARWGDEEIFSKYSRAFVKTKVYQKIVTQSTKFLVGRKGSGKSTLSEIIPYLHKDEYLGSIRVNIDKFPIESIYLLFFKNDKSFKSDLRLINIKEHLKAAWEMFVLTCFIDMLLNLHQAKKINLSTRTFQNFTKFLCELLNINNIKESNELQNKQSAFLTSAFEYLYTFISINNQELNSSRPLTNMLVKNDSSKFRKFVFGEEIIDNLIEITEAYQNYKIFLSFDGFDTEFDLFRREGLDDFDTGERIKFEIYWIWSFIQLILDSNRIDSTFKSVFKLFNYCITIPRDRFLEIESKDRDKYRYNHQHFGELHWTGPELCNLLRKRLEILSDYISNEKTLIKKFEDVCFKKYSTIPLQVSFTFNQKTITLPLFSYVLRHTFWRPREILWFYAGIIAAARDEEKNNTKLDSDKIREIIKFTTSQVVESEFIGEFESSFLNIHVVLNRFEGKKQILVFDELTKILNPIHFEITNSKIETITQKVEYLYEIGFLGVKNSTLGVTNKKGKPNSLLEYSFIFTNGFSHIKNLNNNYNNVEFIIHPIFYEKYNIETSGNDFLLSFDLEDLRNHESIIFGTKKGV